ncbi:MAG TPA: hypothetical protein VFE33_19095 [Thermoanaerobaculia bacterium]|nr:hypothetical protein [Thermoanaerobaculia bacterium]
MSVTGLWPWLVLFGLGAFHGLNPGMGWLFAVGLGLQERRRGAVLAALLPIALGHALSIAAVLAVLWAARESLPAGVLRGVAAAVLLGFGLYRLIRTRHPGEEGMRVSFRHLTAWSFLMASAHGAGLMLVPLLLGGQAHAGHTMHMPAAPFATPLAWLGAVAVHTLGHLLVAALVALLVYEKLGLSLLRRAAFNLDLLWGIALVVCGVVILVV